MSKGGTLGDGETRTAISEAAVRVLAGRGIGGLTHSAVDAEADLPDGASAAHYPDRDDLVGAVVTQLVAIDGSLWTQAGDLTPKSTAEFAQRMARWVELALTTQPVAGRARLELFVGEPKRAAAGHQAILEVAVVVLDVLGVKDPAAKARLVVDLVSGTMTHHLTVRADESFDAGSFERGLARLLADR